MSDACNQTPFWQRQPQLPKAIQDFLRTRAEAALLEPADRQVLVWPTVLGAPRLRQNHPEGLPEALLLSLSESLLRPLGILDPGSAWEGHRKAWPDTAQGGPDGWLPHRSWGAWGPLVSLRMGWQLAALTPLPPDARYPLACGVSLFNHGLYHECHDALEVLWATASGELKAQLQVLILMAGGYHHLQQANLPGMLALWEDAVERMHGGVPTLATPWGVVQFGASLDLTAQRLDHGKRMQDAADFAPLWALDRPTWELS